MATTEELERRVRTLEEELAGERHVSRFQVEQAVRNSEVLHAVRADVAAVRADVSGVTARVDILAGDMASVKSALVMHGRALDVLQQDVRQFRQDMTELRADMTARFGRLEANVVAILAAVTPQNPPPGGA
jgi:hypothetical protein